MVEEQRDLPPQPPVIRPVGRDIKRHNYALIGMLILIIGTLASFALTYLLGLSGISFLTTGNVKPNAIMAKAMLMNAITVADAYAATHDGSYLGMDAATLGEFDATVPWTAGRETGKVAVVAATDRSLTLVYTDRTGAQYTAVKDEGELVIADEAGRQI